MSAAVKPIPEGYHSITPALVSSNAGAAIDFYKKVFNATEKGGRAVGPDGKIVHAELRIGDSVFFINDTMGPASALGTEPKIHPLQLHLYVEDADAVFNRAVASGARVDMPLQNMFWGDRFGKVVDPFGHTWAIATHVEDVAPQEMERRMRDFFAKTAGQHS
ncbi:MAG TPA: VOC family protein [Candidatus Acidoferrales bacterium]|nr:VOC family protein [Candidatus Acidoferrales bacterium]